MKGKRIGQWVLLAVICLSFSIGETFAQKKDFANLARYAKENVALPKPAKKEKRRGRPALRRTPPLFYPLICFQSLQKPQTGP